MLLILLGQDTVVCYAILYFSRIISFAPMIWSGKYIFINEPYHKAINSGLFAMNEADSEFQTSVQITIQPTSPKQHVMGLDSNITDMQLWPLQYSHCRSMISSVSHSFN